MSGLYFIQEMKASNSTMSSNRSNSLFQSASLRAPSHQIRLSGYTLAHSLVPQEIALRFDYLRRDNN